MSLKSCLVVALVLWISPLIVWAEQAGAPPTSASKVVNGALQRIATLVEPVTGQPVRSQAGMHL